MWDSRDAVEEIWGHHVWLGSLSLRLRARSSRQSARSSRSSGQSARRVPTQRLRRSKRRPEARQPGAGRRVNGRRRGIVGCHSDSAATGALRVS